MKIPAALAIIALSASGALAAAPDTPREIVIGVSPFQPAAERTNQQCLLQRFLLSQCPTSTRVVVWDAWQLQVLWDIPPFHLAYDSPAARAPRLAPALAAIGRWSAATGAGQIPASLKDSAAIKVPEWLAAVAATPAAGQRTVVILASPFCLVPDEPTFSMVHTRYPSDAHLDRTLAQTPYAARRGLLAGTEVNWAYSNENVWTSEHHRYLVTRWWGLWVGAAGGRLIKFSSDAPQVLIAATRTNQRAVGDFVSNPADNTLVMHTAAQREVPLEIPQARPALPPPLPVQPVAKPEVPPALPPPAIVATPPPAPPVAPPRAPVETPPAPAPEPPNKPASEAQATTPVPTEIPTPAVGNIGIAAVWSAERDTDIDLWVAARPGLPEAYWHRPSVERVSYFRDIRTSQRDKANTQWRQAWEYVEVERAQVEEPTVWLNVYAASGPVSGIVRVQFGGRVVDRPFKFAVRRGNKGLDSKPSARARSPYWQEVKLADFFPAGFTQNNLK